MQVGDLTKARKDMTKLIRKQQAQKDILGIPLITPAFSQAGLNHDKSDDILDEAEMHGKEICVRSYLDFADESERLRKLK